MATDLTVREHASDHLVRHDRDRSRKPTGVCAVMGQWEGSPFFRFGIPVRPRFAPPCLNRIDSGFIPRHGPATLAMARDERTGFRNMRSVRACDRIPMGLFKLVTQDAWRDMKRIEDASGRERAQEGQVTGVAGCIWMSLPLGHALEGFKVGQRGGDDRTGGDKPDVVPGFPGATPSSASQSPGV